MIIGLYEFHLTMSHVNPGMAAAIVLGGQIVSPLGYVTPSGAMSTTTIVRCDANQQVYAQVCIIQPIMVLISQTFYHILSQ